MSLLDESSPLLTAFERLLKTHATDITAELREENRKLHVRLDVAHEKLNTALVALSHVIPRINDMSAIHDQIAAALGENDTAIAGIQASAATLEDLKDEGDSASADLLTKVQAQGTTLAAIKAQIDAAVKADTPVEAGSGAVSAAGASTPTAPVVTTSTLPSGAPVTTTVDPNAGTTQAVVTDPGTGTVLTTTLQHVDGSASTVDPTGTPVATSAEAVQAATEAAQAAGVTVPAAG